MQFWLCFAPVYVYTTTTAIARQLVICLRGLFDPYGNDRENLRNNGTKAIMIYNYQIRS